MDIKENGKYLDKVLSRLRKVWSVERVERYIFFVSIILGKKLKEGKQQKKMEIKNVIDDKTKEKKNWEGNAGK